MFPKFQLVDKEQQTQRKKIQLKVPKKRKQGIQLNQATKDILNESFISAIVGRPGSGKSHLITELVTRIEFYGKKFDRFLYVGPTKFKQLVLQQNQNWNPNLDQLWIQEKISQTQKWGGKQVLIIVDDAITQITDKKRSTLQSLVFNRRHIIPQGTISWIFTSQKYKLLPTWIRVNLDQLWCFNVPPVQQQHILKQVPMQIDRIVIQVYLKRLKDHMFLFFNIKKGKLFNNYFQKL